jgi:hypothetical protein
MRDRRWYELPAEIGIVLFPGLLTYLGYRYLLGLSNLAGIIAGTAIIVVMGLSIYCGHRLRARHLESLPLEEQAVVAWRLVRRGAVGGLLGLLAAGFGFLGTYLIGWMGAPLSGLGSLAISLALGLAALFIVLRAWPRSSPPE